MDANLLEQLDTLPPLPYVAHDILLKVNSDIDLGEIAQAIAMEPGLSARIIAMANSAFFAGQSTVMDIETAVVRIGLNRIRVMAATVLLSDQFDVDKCPGFDASDYWKHSVETAFCAGRLASRIPNLDTDADAAYLAGLIHNIGIILLSHVFPDEMTQVFETWQQQPETPLAVFEREKLSFDHHKAGGLLMKEWDLPKPLIDVCEHFNDQAYRGDFPVFKCLIEFCSNWVNNDLDEEFPVPDQLNLNEKDIYRTRKMCLNEREHLASFANLLAGA